MDVLPDPSSPRRPLASHAAETRGPVRMSQIRVVPRESPERRQAREQREQLDKITTELVASWWDHHNDPFMIEALRGLTLAKSLDNAHLINRQGHCRRWRCTRQWWFPLTRRPCPTRVTLRFCRAADTVTLWFHLLNQLPNLNMSLATVRTWLEGCHTNKPQTDKSKEKSTTIPSTSE